MTLVLAYTPTGHYTTPPTLEQSITSLRQDLYDRTHHLSDTPARWVDDDLIRALEHAISDYSYASPLMQASMTSTLPSTRSYACPSDAWWIESVEYPSGCYPPRLAPFKEIVTPRLGTPSAAPQAMALDGPGVLDGTFTWRTTFFKSGAETTASPSSVPLTLQGQNAILTAIPIGPPGTVGRALYRSRHDGAEQAQLVTQIFDNSTTSWNDSISDAELGVPIPTSDTTSNCRQFVLKLSPSHLPRDTRGVITVTYAGRHELRPSGTSIPDHHIDVVLLGAAAYALLAYQVPTNDFFEFQDGEMRDRVDERSVPTAWLSAGTQALTRFNKQLEEIKSRHNAGLAAVTRWGDTPVHWQRT